MQSHHKYRFWFVSLLVHLCLAMVFSFIIINQPTPSDADALEVSILKVKPVPPVKKTPRIEAPPIAPTPKPNFQIERLSASVQTRAFTSHPEKSTSVSMPKAVAADVSISQSRAQSARTQITVQGASQVNDRSVQSLTTAVNLPVQSDAPLSAGLSTGSSLSGSRGIGEGSGSGVGRGSFGLGGGVGQTRTGGGAGLGSLVGAEGASNIDDTLANAADKVTLGGEVAELPPGSPGAIVVGRGRDIMGRLNLARFEDPLHPSADI